MKNMNGTENQVRWAENIKESAYGTINANVQLLNEKLEKYPNWNSLKNEIRGYEKVREALDIFFGQVTEASQVIDKRFIMDGESIVHQAKIYAKKFND